MNLGAASTKSLLLADPDGNVVTKTLSFTTDGSDGQVEYVLVSGDLDEAGVWTLQLKIVNAGTYTIYTSEEQFEVEAVLA